MNARTSISINGEITLPADLRERLGWIPGTALEVVQTAGGVALREPRLDSPALHTTLADLDALPGYDGPRQPIQAISSLSTEDINRLLNEGD